MTKKITGKFLKGTFPIEVISLCFFVELFFLILRVRACGPFKFYRRIMFCYIANVHYAFSRMLSLYISDAMKLLVMLFDSSNQNKDYSVFYGSD